MENQQRRTEIVSADVIQGNVIIYFSNGNSTLFSADFLYRSREADQNAVLNDSDDLQVPGKAADD